MTESACGSGASATALTTAGMEPMRRTVVSEGPGGDLRRPAVRQEVGVGHRSGPRGSCVRGMGSFGKWGFHG